MQPKCQEMLPRAGRISCSICFNDKMPEFDKTVRVSRSGDWRITANPLAWGNSDPGIVALGFSKGPSQAGELTSIEHDQIAYRKGRIAVGKVFAHLGLISTGDNQHLRATVDRIIADSTGQFHFGSLIRCAVQRREGVEWKGTGGGMLDGFVADEFGREIASNCARRFLKDLPGATRLVIMFGLGSRGNYVRQARALIQEARPGRWRIVNPVAYADDRVTFVHVEHFAAQGNLLPRWLGETKHDRARFGLWARQAVEAARFAAPKEQALRLAPIC